MSHPGLAAATSLKESKPNPVAIKPNQLDFRLGLCYQLLSLLLVFPWNVANHRPGKQITYHYLPTSHGFSICFRVSGLHPRNTKLAASRSFLDPRHDWTSGIPPRAIHFQGTKQSSSHYSRRWGHWNTSYRDTLVLEQTSIDYWHDGDHGLKGTSSYQENSFNISSVYTVHFQIGTGYTKLTISHSELSISLSLSFFLSLSLISQTQVIPFFGHPEPRTIFLGGALRLFTCCMAKHYFERRQDHVSADQ